MKTNKPIKIVAMGKYLPKAISSEELENNLGFPLGWSERYSGVKNRHQVTFEHNGYMGASASEIALEKANMTLGDIDLIIAGGATFDYVIPNQASVIKEEMKDGNKYHPPAIDIDSTCLSFLAALNLCASLLDGDQYKNILVVSTEVSSKGLNPNNRETSTLFGDAAVAVIVQHAPNSDSFFIKGGQRTYSEGVNNAIIKGGGLKHHFSTTPYDEKLHSFEMRGKQLLKLAKRKLPEFMDWFFEGTGMSLEKIPIIIPHQASKMGLVILDSLYNLKPNQVKSTLSKYGNCIAASIPLTLHDCIENGEVKRGDTCFLVGTSAGFSIGGTLIIY